MSMIRFLAIVLITLVAVRCDMSWGRCPEVKYELDSFDLNKYLGTWYELAREKSIPFQRGDCTQATYSLNDDGTVKVVNSEVVDGKINAVVGRADRTENPFRLKVSFSDTFLGKLFKGDYQVVNTDYENFTIVYSCTNLLVARSEFFWILSRHPQVSAERLDDLTSYVAQKFNTTKDSLRITDRSEAACKHS
jgi:apolipoprotein D and lipocalin family protein